MCLDTTSSMINWYMQPFCTGAVAEFEIDSNSDRNSLHLTKMFHPQQNLLDLNFGTKVLECENFPLYIRLDKHIVTQRDKEMDTL